MAKAAKLLDKMRNNPLGNWRIDDLKTVARRHGIEWRQHGTSHVVFIVKPEGISLPVPADKPIKPVYIREFLKLLEKTTYVKEE